MHCALCADFDGMDSRSEPRIQIYARGKLTLLDHPERQLESLLLDVSATGMKFVVNESLPVDEIIGIEVEDHLVLADVRYSEARGDKFTVGAERIHAVEKGALPQDKTSVEQIRFVVDDYRKRIRSAISGDKVQGQKEDVPIQHRDQVVEAAVQKLTEKWAKESEGSASDGTLRAAIVERGGGRLAEPMPTPIPQGAKPHSVRSSWRLLVVIAGSIAMIAFTGSLFWSYRHSVAATTSHIAVVASSAIAEIKAAPVPNQAMASATRHAEIRVSEPAWVYAVSDGKEVFRKLLAKDETRQIEFAEKALLRVGNAGGVEISVDGKSIGPLGPRGKIRVLEITPDGHRFVPVSSMQGEEKN
jgi:hypothetical protein